MTEQAQKPTVEEALETMKQVKGPVRLLDFRPVKMYAELIEPKDDHGTQIITNQQHGSVEAHRTFIRTQFSQTFKSDGGTEGTVHVSCSVSFALTIVYEFPADVPPETQIVYAKIMGIMHSWPYYRAFVASAMGQMGAMGVIGPLINPPRAAQMAGYVETNPENRLL